jgi:hypothetical protein
VIASSFIVRLRAIATVVASARPAARARGRRL